MSAPHALCASRLGWNASAKWRLLHTPNRPSAEEPYRSLGAPKNRGGMPFPRVVAVIAALVAVGHVGLPPASGSDLHWVDAAARDCLLGRTAIVTGATRGIGREVEIALPDRVAVRIGAGLEVLALGPHRHDSEPRSARPDQPTEPSICSSIKRLHSTAYSIGSVLVIGSMNPLTTMPTACSSVRPRDMR